MIFFSLLKKKSNYVFFTVRPTHPFLGMVLFVLSLFFSLTALSNTNNKLIRWCVYYSDKAPIAAFKDYSFVVLDSDFYSKLVLESLVDNKKIVLGYISLGEIENHRWYYHKFKKEGILLQENKNWKGSYYVDIRKKIWTKFVINYLVPDVIHKGFSGIFIDTMDNPSHLEDTFPYKFREMKTAAINLIKTIRKHYPNIKIMLNRGYDILPEVANEINYELGECVYTDYNFKTKKYYFVDKNEYEDQVRLLKNAAKVNPRLKIFTLDYWYENDKKTIEKIYTVEKGNGFIPYVSTISLNKIITP